MGGSRDLICRSDLSLLYMDNGRRADRDIGIVFLNVLLIDAAARFSNAAQA
ncbi:hypothetical protein D3C78_1477920 [compost metagenome]